MTTELEKANAVVADLERKRQSVVDHYDKLASERAAINWVLVREIRQDGKANVILGKAGL